MHKFGEPLLYFLNNIYTFYIIGTLELCVKLPLNAWCTSFIKIQIGQYRDMWRIEKTVLLWIESCKQSLGSVYQKITFYPHILLGCDKTLLLEWYFHLFCTAIANYYDPDEELHMFRNLFSVSVNETIH